jgi:hypothetical protein
LILENLSEGLVGRLPLYKGGEGDLEIEKSSKKKYNKERLPNI